MHKMTYDELKSQKKATLDRKTFEDQDDIGFLEEQIGFFEPEIKKTEERIFFKSDPGDYDK